MNAQVPASRKELYDEQDLSAIRKKRTEDGIESLRKIQELSEPRSAAEYVPRQALPRTVKPIHGHDVRIVQGDDLHCEDGTDCRNYGVLGGIEEAKELLGAMIEVPADNILIFGNSSLNIMCDSISRSMTHGVIGTPWSKLDCVKFCVRYPATTGISPSPSTWHPDGQCAPQRGWPGHGYGGTPRLHGSDVKGIWCVPKYSNPTGITYSEETVQRFARLKPAARDFRILGQRLLGAAPV